ncbi:MAG: tetratricopeptide repeat protein [Simkaniaceae bacterium]|nr:tetratricopeptide repeat protein [Candidatus Sacchlamyda saccharinae]
MKKTLLLFLLPAFCGFADFTLKDGKLVERDYVATQSVQEHYSNLMEYLERGEWKRLEQEATILIRNFPNTSFSRDATYFLGVAYFNQDDYEMANIQLTDYLTRQATPTYFEEAIQYKFEIAEKFRHGARKHIMGFKSLPKWMPAGSEAITVYDEVISALPHHELAARSHYGKAGVQAANEDYRASIESYQTLIRRFPKHPLAVESYIGIGEIYLQQSQNEFPDPDLLDLTALNLRKFQESFPGEEKIGLAQDNYVKMQDHYASALYETARFYERTKKWGAAKIYYAKILNSYPDSFVAKKCRDRLEIVEVKLAYVKSR